MNEKRYLWTPAAETYMRRHAHHAGDGALSSELALKVGIRYPLHEVGRKREELGLAPPDPDALNARALRAGYMIPPSLSKSDARAEKTPTLSAKMESAASPAPIAQASPFKDDVPIVPFANKLVPVAMPKEGGIYVVAGVGPARYKGMEPLRAAGMEMDMHVFEKLHGKEMTAKIPPHKLEIKVREVMPPEMLKAAMAIVASGGQKPVKLPLSGDRYKRDSDAFEKKLMGTCELGIIAGVLHTAFTTKQKIGSNTQTAIERVWGNLASEVAVVTGVDYNAAHKWVGSHRTNGVQPASARPVSPSLQTF